MESVLVAMAVLACPLGMGLCMWMMARGMRSNKSEETAEPSVSELREEQQRIAARIEGLEQNGGAGRSLARPD